MNTTSLNYRSATSLESPTWHTVATMMYSQCSLLWNMNWHDGSWQKKWNCSRFNKKFQQCNTFSRCNPCFKAPTHLGTLSPSHNSQQHFIMYTNNITQFTHPSDCSWIPLSLSSLLQVWTLNTFQTEHKCSRNFVLHSVCRPPSYYSKLQLLNHYSPQKSI